MIPIYLGKMEYVLMTVGISAIVSFSWSRWLGREIRYYLSKLKREKPNEWDEHDRRRFVKRKPWSNSGIVEGFSDMDYELRSDVRDGLCECEDNEKTLLHSSGGGATIIIPEEIVHEHHVVVNGGGARILVLPRNIRTLSAMYENIHKQIDEIERERYEKYRSN